MSRNYYMPTDDTSKDLWLKNFANKLAVLSAKYGINPTEVNDMVASSAHFSYWLNYRNQQQDFLQKINRYKNESRDGIPANAAIPTGAPVAPSVAGMPTPVAPGIFARAASLVLRIKSHKDYLESDGAELGIIGTETQVDLNQIQPEINVRISAAGHPEIVWTKNRMDMLEIQVNRGNGYELMSFDSHPNSTDTAALPASGQSAVWKYKAIYRLHNEQVGQWSAEHSIAVHSI